ncbi:MAG: DUF4175 family protein [Polyangiaceae bacterium]|nr:DUF4175 family protein [Polyangiaceae bacterium]
MAVAKPDTRTGAQPAIAPEWLSRLRSSWDAEISPSVRRVIAALFALAFVLLALLARMGTQRARFAAAAIFAALILGAVARAVIVRKRRADPRRTIAEAVGRTDPDLSAATLRALSLSERTLQDDNAGSPALAALHLRRLLDRAPLDVIRRRAASLAAGWSVAALFIAGAALAIVVAEPFRIIEGLDVLAARNGTAPLPLFWVDDISMSATPPSYLHESEELLNPFTPVALPRGTKIAVRGTAVHSGRQLLISDGRTETPFVGDGGGGIVAHLTLTENSRIHIVAAFGDVRIPQADEQVITAIADEAPKVRVAGAPRTTRILDEPNIALTYEAEDDHGLREVVLSMRAGAREERRILSRPATDAKTDKGSVQLGPNDPFFRKTYAPVEVRIEARDNDEVSGPKWGKSEAVIVVLPQAGEPEALRYAELLKARDQLTDLLAHRIETKFDPKTSKDIVAAETDAQKRARQFTMEALGKTFAGLTPNGRMTALARGQWSRLDKSLDAFSKAPSQTTYDKLIHETEDALLAFDGGLRALAVRDTRAVAKRLADVADETALAAGALALGMDTESAALRLDASFGVLDSGGKQLLKLGELGLDLGEIVASDLRRIDRARKPSDFKHAELAAQDLAARLRKPDASFSGGGGGGGGVESGGAPSMDPSEASDADAEQAANEQELEDLARDHATEMNQVSQALDRAEREEREAIKEAAREHAKNIRNAVKDLPKQGRPETAEAEAAAGRQEAEGMAGSLDSQNLKDAVERGKEALKALKEAKRLGGDSFFDKSTGQKAAEAAETLERELKWAEEALEKLRKAARERAKEELSKSSKNEEKLAERARSLSEKAHRGNRTLDQDTLDRLTDAERAMREAQRALQEGDGEKGKKQQETAQRALEMAQNRKDDESGDRSHGTDEDPRNKPIGGKADIPGKDKYKGPEAFRKRVMDGLSGPVDPALKEAVKRYAEGLLK